MLYFAELSIEYPVLPACKGTEITFNATQSSSDLSQITGVEWNFGDGTIIEDTNISTFMSQKQTYAKDGTYTLTPKKSGGEAVTDGIKTLSVPIFRCIMPVNPNIHIYNK
jgi:PKD domain.